ncbi:hypothetical protein E7681_02435 [Thalassobius vesicularis]|uniref:Uncharacterized protein n=1 Tax=Thalassobius vesicularis TaxID=1294297 RepID=A0A4S3MEY9_9RHOB|nr:hypothetical protein [Thalassobius vesicularis]THD76718.1 hypothetical protein E7681_02435 [Thalassobius vesicularis]
MFDLLRAKGRTMLGTAVTIAIVVAFAGMLGLFGRKKRPPRYDPNVSTDGGDDVGWSDGDGDGDGD